MGLPILLFATIGIVAVHSAQVQDPRPDAIDREGRNLQSDCPTDDTVKRFSITTLMSFQGQPGLAKYADVPVLQSAMAESFNSLVSCSDGTMNVNVMAIDFKSRSQGGILGTGYNLSTPFTWKMNMIGTCTNCNVEAIADGLLLSNASACGCSMPSHDEYLEHSNDVLGDMNMPFAMTRATVMYEMFSNRPLPPLTNFTTSLTVIGRSPEDEDFDSKQLGYFSRGVLSTYNEMNILNPEVCDPYERTIIDIESFVLEPIKDPTRVYINGIPFRTLFEIRGTCRGCPAESSIVIKEDDPEMLQRAACPPMAGNVMCPAGVSEMSCPTETSFLRAFQVVLNRISTQNIPLDELNPTIKIDPLFADQVIQNRNAPAFPDKKEPKAGSKDKLTDDSLRGNLNRHKLRGL